MKLNLSVFLLTCLISTIVIVNAKLVMIIRHGEKLNDEVTDLSPTGKSRAYCLVNVFGKNGTYATPQRIFAQNPTEKKQSTRPRDTVQPLAESLGLNVDLSYTSGQIKKLTNFIINSSDEVTLVSWNNDNIPDIAEKLGITNPPKWDNDDFDDIWMIYDSNTPSFLNSNSVSKRAVYSGTEGFNMEIVQQNIRVCISENFSKFANTPSSSNNNNSSGAIHLKNSIYMMIASLLFYIFVTMY